MRTILVTDYLEQTARRFPDKEAFTDDLRSITFSELRGEALALASEISSLKIFKSPVVVYMDKSVACVSSFLGVAYSGNFYTPIDTEMPVTRIKKILETLQPCLIITDFVHKEKAISFAEDVPILIYEEHSSSVFINEILVHQVTSKIVDEDILYVFFTSGSTGIPKGVIIPHRAVVNFIDWFVSEFSLDENSIIGNQVPFYFDVSVQDIYGALKVGATTHLLNKSLFLFPIQLMQVMTEKKVNVIVWVPSALCLVANLKALQVSSLPPLNKVMFCGEVMPNKQLNQWRKAYPQAMFVNLYGPTEACDAMMFFVVNRAFADEESLPIGKPIKNVDVIVLNSENKVVCGDVQGELCIRGAALAHGYYHNKEKTFTAFIQNPLNSNYPEIIYRTGDLVHYNEMGELVYDGRKDFQIKHMGHRIELGEIETAVSSLDGIQQNCCLYDEKKGKIVLFYTGYVEAGSIGAQLKYLLPEYMMPGKKIKLEQMPLNLNGKIDRVKLRELIK